MHIILIIIGAVILYFAVAKYLNNQPEKFNNVFSKVLAVALGVVAFLILVKGNIPAAIVLATGAVLSWQGSLWTYLQSKAQASNGATPQVQSTDKMTRKEALEILELTGDPTHEEIKAAHHKLMKKIHPDQGGSGYFAAKLNQSKDILLK
jgi:hypothetical protein